MSRRIRQTGCSSCQNTLGGLRRIRAHLNLVKLALFLSQLYSARQTWAGLERIVQDCSWKPFIRLAASRPSPVCPGLSSGPLRLLIVVLGLGPCMAYVVQAQRPALRFQKMSRYSFSKDVQVPVCEIPSNLNRCLKQRKIVREVPGLSPGEPSPMINCVRSKEGLRVGSRKGCSPSLQGRSKSRKGGSYLVQIKKERADCNPMQSGRVEGKIAARVGVRLVANKKDESKQKLLITAGKIVCSKKNEKEKKERKERKERKKVPTYETEDDEEPQKMLAEPRPRKDLTDIRDKRPKAHLCMNLVINKALDNPVLLGEPIKNPVHYDDDEGFDRNVYKPNARRQLFVLDSKSEDLSLTTLSLQFYEPRIHGMI
ncbi:hypothetical protein Tco_0013324 [Tanacetum coccineum]